MTDMVKSFKSGTRGVNLRKGQQAVNLKEAFSAYGIDLTSGEIEK